MIVFAIAAIDRTGLIGDGTKMPWHLSRDLRRFRAYTIGMPIVMGRRTFESIGGPLEGRLNIVLTHRSSFLAPGCRVARSVGEALNIAKAYVEETRGDRVWIIGGGAVFEETLPLWDRLVLTVVEGQFQGNTYFPLKKLQETRWRVAARQFFEADARNQHPHWFLSLRRQGEDSSREHDFDIRAWLSERPDQSQVFPPSGANPSAPPV